MVKNLMELAKHVPPPGVAKGQGARSSYQIRHFFIAISTSCIGAFKEVTLLDLLFVWRDSAGAIAALVLEVGEMP